MGSSSKTGLWFRKRGQWSPHKSPCDGEGLPRSRCVFGTWCCWIALPLKKIKRPSPQTINMSFLNPKRRLQQYSMPPSLPPCSPPSFTLFQHIPLSTSFLPHPLNFNTCLSCFLLFLSPSASPLLHQTLAAYLVITRALRKPFHLKDWQLSQWNTIKWLPLKRKGKFELRYAAACRTALLLKWEQRWRSCRRCNFFLPVLTPPPPLVLLKYLIIKRPAGKQRWRGSSCAALSLEVSFLLVVGSPLFKYEPF